MVAVVWLGMTAVLKTGAEITMHLSLGMMLSMDEILLEEKFRCFYAYFSKQEMYFACTKLSKFL